MACAVIVGVSGLLTSAFYGCATYQPAPLIPAETARDFDRRSLTNPRLCDYLRANLKPSPAVCPPPRWDLQALTLAGFYYSPDSALAQTRIQQFNAAVITAGARPNPVIGLGPEYVVHNSPNFAPWAIGSFSLDLPIETAGKRGYRIAQAERLADAARLAAGETAWSVRSRIRAALQQYLFDQRRYRLAQQQQDALAQSASLMAARLRAGEASQPQLDLALSGLESARLITAQAEARVPDDRNALAAAIGLPIAALDGARFTWTAMDNPPGEASLAPNIVQRMALLNRIDLRRALTQYAASDEALKLEIAKQYPDIHLTGGYSWEGGENIFELGPSLALPVFNQNQGPIAEAQARRKAMGVQFMAMQAAIIAQSRGALINYRGALAALEAARSAAIYQARRYHQAARAAAVGESDSITLSAARLQNVSAQQMLLQALNDAQGALGALEDSMQRPLESGDASSFSFPPPHNSEVQAE
ncbi:MAG: TolC family protein [Candidatus Binataceae bacterium]|nr:TolC family protein [Candidatus Binataceae bacterium]